MKHRSGTSLVELLIVMSVSSVVLTISAAMVHRVLHVHSHSQRFHEAERASLRLSRQWRSDIHAAQSAMTGPDLPAGTIVRLQHSQQEVSYRRAGDRLLRVVHRDGDPVAQEVFAFGREVEVQVEQDEAPTMITLTLTAAGHPAPARLVPVSLRLSAVLGKDHSASAEETAP